MLTREKAFYKNFFSLYGPILLQNIIILGVSLVDNLMLGSYSEAAVAGVASVNQIQFLLQMLTIAIGDGMVILASQYWGQRRIEPIRKLSSISLKTGLLVSMTLFAIASIFPLGTVQLFTQNAEIVREGADYLNLIRFTYPLFTVSSVLIATLRSVESVRISFYVTLSTLIVKCCLNYVLIFGKFGAPVLGASGAALATIIARVIELTVIIVYLLAVDKKLQLRIRDYIRTDRELLKDYARVSTPAVLQAASWGVAVVIQTAMLGNLKEQGALAAYGVATTLYQFIRAFSVATSATSAVIIGRTIGEGKIEKTKEYARTMQYIYLFVGILCGIILFSVRGSALSLYKISSDTRVLADQFMIILSFVFIGMAYQMPVSLGIIRGGGDSKFVLQLEIISTWLILVPLTALAAFVFHWSPAVVVLCMNSDQLYKCIPVFIRVNSFKWIKKLTRENK
ncbi:MAG: MATE family efflux transporter [Eubacteriales bacterium]|nr:MATE family efflux transporter [Eubacteriales bacterium]